MAPKWCSLLLGDPILRPYLPSFGCLFLPLLVDDNITMMEALHSFYHNDDQIVLKAILSVFCLGSAFLLWFRPINNHAATATNACNNPSCLRCHSTSQQHAQSFQSNVMMLRRLVQLEPELFRDMRGEIWDEVAIIEQRFESNHHNTSSSSFLKQLLELLTRTRRLITLKKSHDTTNEQNMIPLSPQKGQNPTVFFVQQLEAIPLHNIEACTKQDCPCIRLWKELPLLPNAPPVKLTGDIETLKTHFSVIREELLSAIQTNTATFHPFDDAVYEHANGNEQKQQEQQAEWSSIYLYRQGIKQVDTCKKYFSITTNILETMCPHRMGGCGFGSVYFSKLKQNTKVVEHCGPTNVRLRCHLPLAVPNKTSGSYLRVGEHCVSWEEGKPILFDDSFLHSAVYAGCNDSDGSSISSDQSSGDRIVLIVDFWHPSLSVADRTALGVLYPPGS